MQRREFVRSALATAGAATGVAAFGTETGPGGGPHQEWMSCLQIWAKSLFCVRSRR